MSWSGFVDGVDTVVDAVESWISEQVFWVQVPILLAVLIPLCWLVGGLVDRLVERILRPRSRQEVLASGVHPAGRLRRSPPSGESVR